MKPLICQSCGFPFSEERSGTNRDLSRNQNYCLSCYESGDFTDKHLSLHEMQRRLLEMASEHNEISLEEAREIIKILPDLKRWKMTHIL